MHILQPKHVKLSKEEVDKFLSELNASLSQLPRIKQEDAGLPEGCEVGDVVKIERKKEGQSLVYYRVVV